MIELRLDKLPPSSNQLYRSFHGGLILSSSGKKYRAQVHVELLAKLLPEHSMNRNRWHSLEFVFLFPAIYTKTAGAKSRFIRVDTSNRIKLLEDVLCEIFGTDDSCFLRSTQSKAVGQGVIVRIKELDDSGVEVYETMET